MPQTIDLTPPTSFNNRELPVWPVAVNQIPSAIKGKSTWTHSVQSPVSQPSAGTALSPTNFLDAPDTGASGSRTSTFTAAQTAGVASLNAELTQCQAWLTAITALLPPGAPTITTVAPATGAAAGGTAVTLTGTNFTGATQVRFGSAAATNVVVASATSITCTTPAGSGAVGVTVVAPGGEGYKASAFTYALPPAQIALVTPNDGSIAGGDAVVIVGAGFTGATGVTFGGTAGTGFSVMSATTINVTTPAHAAGAVNVVVQSPNGNGTQNNGFTYE
jgi:IPT/TIG domain